MTTVASIAEKMIAYSAGNLHDIQHLLKVWGYAKIIGELEQLDQHTQFILEVAALLHDIACPLCREKYGCADAKRQEEEGPRLAAPFLRDSGMTEEDISRVCFLIGHHHTYTGVDAPDYQILLEADYLVNAAEKQLSPQQVKDAGARFFRTESGTRLLHEIYTF